MPVQYVNRWGKTYYLHQGVTKTGKPQYYFSMKIKENVLDAIPEGYEIHEEPLRAQVFLRKKEPGGILENEKALVEAALEPMQGSRRYISHLKGKSITILQSDQNLDELREHLVSEHFLMLRSSMDGILTRSLSYTAVMRFTLVDAERRHFRPERYCFRGSVDDWISIGVPDALDALVSKFLGFLGGESLYELF